MHSPDRYDPDRQSSTLCAHTIRALRHTYCSIRSRAVGRRNSFRRNRRRVGRLGALLRRGGLRGWAREWGKEVGEGLGGKRDECAGMRSCPRPSCHSTALTFLTLFDDFAIRTDPRALDIMCQVILVLSADIHNIERDDCGKRWVCELPASLLAGRRPTRAT